MKIVFLLITISISLRASSQSINDKIKAVENNLGGWVKIENQPGWNIYDRMKFYNVKSVSIAVINNYQIEWTKAYGWADTAEKRKATVQTLFQPASIGKSIHAVGTMKLVEDGLLDPEADINSYLKRWKFPYDSVSKGKKITTLHLLSNSGGLSVHGFDGYKPNQPLPTIIQILNGEAPANSPAVRSEFEPGVRFQYSGGGYTISGMMVEDITGMNFADYMTRSVLLPFGMRNTFYHSRLTGAAKNRLATGYRWDRKPIGAKYHVYAEDACGATLWSTPTDIAKFIVELQLIEAGRGNKILRANTVKKMFTPYVSDFYGLGFFIEQKGDKKWFHHTGLNEGFMSDYYGSVTGGQGIVVMANSDGAYQIDITEEIINAVATVYNWQGFYSPVIKKEVKPSDTIINDYLGTYKFDDVNQTVKIYREGNKLWFHDSSSPSPWLMHFSSDKDFFMTEIVFNNHAFYKGEDGKVGGFEIQTKEGNFKVKRISK